MGTVANWGVENPPFKRCWSLVSGRSSPWGKMSPMMPVLLIFFLTSNVLKEIIKLDSTLKNKKPDCSILGNNSKERNLGSVF